MESNFHQIHLLGRNCCSSSGGRARGHSVTVVTVVTVVTGLIVVSGDSGVVVLCSGDSDVSVQWRQW
jgi:hypothetical protein